MMKRTNWLGLATMIPLLLVACGDSSADGTETGSGGAGGSASGGDGGTGATGGDGGSGGTPVETSTLSLSLPGLEPVGPDYVYEGWVMVDGTPVSTGRFDIEMDVEDYAFDIPMADADAATTFILTIEPAEGDDPAPAMSKLIAGDFADGSAMLLTSHPAALNTDFAGAAGSYILETPTTMETMDDYAQGVWFVDPSGGAPSASLVLPALPEGWIYEGWVVGGDGPVSTGKFDTRDSVDDDGAGPAAGPDMAPPFPGQDFIDPAMMVIGEGALVVISVEPVPDDSPAPFALKPLVDDDVQDLGAGMLQALTNMGTLPAGSATLSAE